MLTKIMKWVCIAVLIGAVFFWTAESSYAVVLQFVVCGTAGLVAFQAARQGKYFWAFGFAGLALLFNPLLTVSFSSGIFRWVNALCLVMFAASIRFLQTAPRLSIPSITYPGPGNQSL